MDLDRASTRSTCTSTSSRTATAALALDQELLDASAKYFRADQDRTPTDRRRSPSTTAPATSAAVVFTVDAPAGTGHPPLSSEEIAEQAAEHPTC